ncbi:MAG: hypothetical protein GY926_13080 [bacterium]|nr:hypothetical protein [bacterium]
MSTLNVVRALGDAVVLSYERTFDRLVVALRLWDESSVSLVAAGVGFLEDIGTWECDGVVRIESLDRVDRLGYGIVDTDLIPTLQFAASSLVLVDADGREERLSD